MTAKLTTNHTQKRYFDDEKTGIKRRTEFQIQRTLPDGSRPRWFDDHTKAIAVPSVDEVQEWAEMNLSTAYQIVPFNFVNTNYIAIVFDAPPTRQEKFAAKMRWA